MPDTKLQTVNQKTSNLRHSFLKQQQLVWNLRKEGGKALEEAQARLESIRNELDEAQEELERLMTNA